MYHTVLLWAHIVSVAAWLGGDLMLFVLDHRFSRRGGDAAAAFADEVSYLAARYYNVAGVAVGTSGVLLVLNTGYGWGSGFVVLGLLTLVVGAALGVLVFVPQGRRLGEALRAGDVSTATNARRRTRRFLTVDALLVAVTAQAMVARWLAR